MSTQPASDSNDARILRAAGQLFIDHRDAEGRALLRTLSRAAAAKRVRYLRANDPNTGDGAKSRRNPSSASRLAVLQRGGWRCSYCGGHLVIAGVIELLGRLAPQEFPFKNHHMKVAETHPAAIRCYPAVGHIRAGARSGLWLDEENLIAACTTCNECKNDGEASVAAFLHDDWDGATGIYRALAERASDLGRHAAVIALLERDISK